MDRWSKKLKTDNISVNINPNTDISALAIERYDQIKKNYNYVSFQDADKSKNLLTCKTEKHYIPIHQFNEEMYKFRKNGYCADPDLSAKGFVFGSKLKEFR